MKIVLQIMDYAAPYEGNFIPSILNLEHHINNVGGRLIYLFPLVAQNIEWAKKLQNDGKTVYFIDRSFFSKKVEYKNINYLSGIIKKEKIDIIHTHFVAYNYTLALMKKLIIPKVRIVGNFMNEFHPPFNKFRKFKIFITRISFDLIIGSSAAVANSLLNAGINSKKITFVNNALDIKHLQQYDKIKIAENENQKVILMFGWTFQRKGVDTAIEAIMQLNSEGKNYILAIALPGNASLIESDIITLFGKVPTFVKFLSPLNNAANYYNAADIFLSASREEGLTYAVMEAAYCSCMLVVSGIGGNPQDIPYTSVYELGNLEQLKSAIIEMSAKTGIEREKINEAQRAYVAKAYNLDSWSEEIIKCYS